MKKFLKRPRDLKIDGMKVTQVIFTKSIVCSSVEVSLKDNDGKVRTYAYLVADAPEPIREMFLKIAE